jgi:hypothetical protein
MVKNFTIPVDASGVTLEQYQKWAKMINTEQAEEDENYLRAKTAAIMWDITYEEVLETKDELVNFLVRQIIDIFSGDKEWMFVNRFVHEEIEYGFIPNLDRMSFGEYVDLDKYFGDLDNFHKAMAVLYRPIKHRRTWKDTYEIEEYRGSEKFAEVMKTVPVNIALGAEVFFYNLMSALEKHTVAYSLERVREQMSQREELDLEKSGVGITQLKLSLAMTYLELKERLGLTSMKP